MYKGIAVSPGVVVGTVYRVDSIFGATEAVTVETPAEVAAEVERFDAAVASAIVELDSTIKRVAEELGPAEADIFRSHLSIVKDRQFHKRVHELVRARRLTALSALQQVLQDYAVAFARMEQEFYRERLADLRDVISRIGAHLTIKRPVAAVAQAAKGAADALATGDESAPATRPDQPDLVVLVAHEILPSQAMELGDMSIGGIVTEAGGGTSHAAILARSRGIPAVSGAVDIVRDVQTGDLIAVDGREGLVHVRPDAETASAYRKMQREFFQIKDRLVANRDEPAVSADGTHVELLANINNLADADGAAMVGATGVGLFRTEYLFITHPDIPTEEQQYDYYRRIIEAAPNRTVTIRTLDLGGDKTVPYLGRRDEPNPFMGWRSIRLVQEHSRIFVRQMRAILRAACHGKVQMLFPMITTLDELRYINDLVKKARRDLQQEEIPVGEDVKTGVMIEVPAAALCIDALLRETDFISIGSNDLIQYLVAADRDNPKVAHLCDPLSPAIFRILQMILDACHRAGTPVTVCGEMAGQPRSVLVLFGLGLRRFSMSPAFVPMIKKLLSSVTIAEAERYAQHVLQLKTTEEIRSYLNARLHEVASTLEIFDRA